MKRSAEKLREDALQIWRAGVEAVQPARLIPEWVQVEGSTLWLGDNAIDLDRVRRIAVVGAGKASGAMASALEETLGNDLIQEKQVAGWVNVPADCLLPTTAIHLHPARPAGLNEPTEEGLVGTERILTLVGELGPEDLCLCLLSGGGSALLPAPLEKLSLADKCDITRAIAAAGGNIQQLNSVRRELSRLKGGGLVRHCQAGQMVSLILSDVLGDDLETIASGPTVVREPTPQMAIQVLRDLKIDSLPSAKRAIALLTKMSYESFELGKSSVSIPVTNLVIGNNATAVDAAGCEAEQLGYSHAMISARTSEGTAEEVALHLSEMAIRMRDEETPDCLITGGEPTVQLCPAEQRGLGGRNQQLALAMLAEISDWQGLCFVSGGTDGEDGPTDAAGAISDEKVKATARDLKLTPADFLATNDAYHFFEEVGGLLKTGPTQTNVCDLRVLVVSR